MNTSNVLLYAISLRIIFCIVSVNVENESGFPLKLGLSSTEEPVSDIRALENVTLIFQSPPSNVVIQSVSWTVS